MHQYKIEVCEYNEEATGANPIPVLTRYADNHEDARLIYQEFRNQKQENESTSPILEAFKQKVKEFNSDE